MWMWLAANWKDLLGAVVAIDVILIPIFPNAGILKSIKTALSPPVPPQ